MAIFSKKIQKELEEVLQTLENEVELHFFTQELECRFCSDTHQMLDELQKLSAKIRLTVHDFVREKELAAQYGIDKIPAIVVRDSEKDYGIRLYGIPSGYEFSSLIEALKTVSHRKTMLSRETIDFLKELREEVRLQVFVTPTCPYCPGAVVLAHHLAYASDKVRGEMVEATEFPQLANKFNVYGVPRTVINEKEFVEGMVPEKVLVDKIRAAIAR